MNMLVPSCGGAVDCRFFKLSYEEPESAAFDFLKQTMIQVQSVVEQIISNSVLQM